MQKQSILTALVALCYGERYLMPLLAVVYWTFWDLSFFSVGLILSAMPLGYHMGLYAARLFTKPAVFGASALLTGAASSLLAAMSTDLIQLVVARCLAGLSCAFVLANIPAGLRNVESSSSQQQWSRAMIVGIPLGVGCAMLFGGVVASFLSAGFVFVLLAVTYLLAFLCRGDVFYESWKNTMQPASEDGTPRKSSQGAFYQIVGAGLYTVALGIVISWFPMWAITELAWTQIRLGFMLASLTLVAIPLGIYLGRRSGQLFCNLDWRAEGYGIFAGMGVCLATSPLFFMLQARDFGSLFFSLFVFLLIMVSLLPPLLRMIQAVRIGIKATTLLSLAMLTTFLIGEVIPGVVGGWLADRTDLYWVINLAPLLALASGLLLILGSYRAYLQSPAARDAFPMSPLAVAASQSAQWVFRQVSKIFHSEIVVLRSDEHTPSGAVVKDPGLDPESPTLLIANHPNALMDAVVIYVTARQPLRSVAKATLWQSPILRPLMKLAGAVPIIRQQDRELLQDSLPRAMKSMQSNDDAMRFVAEALCRHSFVIYPEGRSHDEPAMSAFKTGGARMLLRAAQLVHESSAQSTKVNPQSYFGDVHTSVFLAPKIKGMSDLGFQPVGIYFHRKSSFRSGVVVHYGPRVTLGQVFSKEEIARIPEEGMPPDLVHKLTAAMDHTLREILPEATDEQSLDQVRALASLVSEPHQKMTIRDRYRNELIMKNLVALAAESGQGDRQTFFENLSNYHADRQRAKLPDWLVRDMGANYEAHKKAAWRRLIFAWIMSPLIALPALFGVLLYGWLYRFVGYISVKLAPDKTELATHKLLVGMIFSGFVSLIYAVAATAYVLGAGWYEWMFLAPAVPFLCGLLALQVKEWARNLVPEWRCLLSPATSNQAKSLMQRRQVLMTEFEHWAQKITV